MKIHVYKGTMLYYWQVKQAYLVIQITQCSIICVCKSDDMMTTALNVYKMELKFHSRAFRVCDSCMHSL